MVGEVPHGIARYALGIWNHLPEVEGLAFIALASHEGAARLGLRRRADEIVTTRERFLSLREQVELPRVLSKARVDLLHATSFSLPMFWRGPLVLTLHDAIHLAMPAHTSSAALLYHRTVVRSAVRRAVRVLTVSAFAADELARYYPASRGRTVVAPDAVSVEEIAAEEVPGVPATPYLLYVGNGKPHKNVELLLAARALLRDGPALVLCGEGLERFAGPGVHVVSGARDGQLVSLYRGAALFLFPSRMEGFGLPPLEAAASGAAVLVADSSALRELWAGVAPLLPVDDPRAWAQTIEGLLADRASREALAARCRRHAERFRSWQPAANAALDAYKLGLALAR